MYLNLTDAKNVNFELASLLAFCTLGEAVTFPKGSMQVYTDSLKQLAKNHGMPETMFNASIAYADTVSKAIMAWSKKDMYAQTRSMPEYSVDMNVDGRWVPTPPAYASAMEPNWKLMRCLVMDSCTQFVSSR